MSPSRSLKNTIPSLLASSSRFPGGVSANESTTEESAVSMIVVRPVVRSGTNRNRSLCTIGPKSCPASSATRTTPWQSPVSRLATTTFPVWATVA